MTRWLRLAFAMTALGIAGSAGAETPFRVAHSYPADHPLGVAIQSWANSLKAATNGSIDPTVFPAGQLGVARDMYGFVQTSLVDAALVTPSLLPDRFPVLAASQLPFVFADGVKGTQALDTWYRGYATAEMSDTHFCMAIVHEPGTLHGRKKMARPEDVKGLRIRSPQPTVGEFIALLNGIVTQLPVGDISSALQSGAVDSVAVSWGQAAQLRLDEVAKFPVDFPLYTTPLVLALSKARYDAMTSSQKAAVDAHCSSDWATKLAQPWADAEKRDKEKLVRAAGRNVSKPDGAQIETWKAKAEPLRARWATGVRKAGVDADDAWRRLQATIADVEAGRTPSPTPAVATSAAPAIVASTPTTLPSGPLAGSIDKDVETCRADMDKSALAACTRVIEAGTRVSIDDRMNALYGRATARLGSETPERALEDYSEAIRSQPDEGVNYGFRGQFTYLIKGDSQAATADMREALRRLDLQFHFLFLPTLAHIQLRDGDAAGAQADLDKLEDLYPEKHALHAFALAKKGDFAGAEAELGKAEMKENDDPLRLYRGEVRLLKGDPQNALADFQAALRAQPYNRFARQGVDAAQRAIATGRAAPQASASTSPQTAAAATETLRNLCMSHREAGSAAACTQLIGRAESDPERAVHLMWRAFARLQTGDGTGALADFDEGVRLDPRDPQFRALRGFTRYQVQGDFEGALRDLDEQIRLRPDGGGPSNLTWRAEVRARKGDLAGAQADLARIKDESRGKQAVGAFIDAKSGAFDKADAGIARAKIESDDPLLILRAEVRLIKGDAVGALVDFDTAAKVEPWNRWAKVGREAALRALTGAPAVVAAAPTVAAPNPTLPPVTQANALKRVALLIGNGAYASVPNLPNPIADARAMANLFRAAGFESVTLQTDLTAAAMRKAVREFADLADDADVAVVFYAGHGIEFGGQNYLLPVDAVLRSDRDVVDEAVSVDRIVDLLTPVKRLKFVILDACRDNPFVAKMRLTGGSRSVNRGLGRPPANSSDTLIAYAAEAGSTAADGDGTNSPFTAALLRHLTTPGLDVRIALGEVHDDVMQATRRKQKPFLYGALGGGVLPLGQAAR